MTAPSGQARIYDVLTDSTGTLTPTLRVNAGGAGAGQTLKSYTGTQALSTTASTTITLETVTAGKTFFITDIMVTSNTGSVFTVTINAGSTAIYNSFCKGDTGPISNVGIETQPSAGSGTVVNLVLGLAATATTCAYVVNGYEQ
ncbi:MAG: hypothetical protein NVSMB4_03200 [Acidimicrobiales bacterium]